MTDASDQLQRLRRVFQDKEHVGAVSEARIDAAEQALGVRFPASYREFLREFGAAWLCTPIDIAGLPERLGPGDTPMFGDVVAMNLSRRRYRRKYAHEDPLAAGVKFADDGSEYSFYLDISEMDTSDECCVRILGPGRENIVVARTFLEFVEKVSHGGREAVLP